MKRIKLSNINPIVEHSQGSVIPGVSNSRPRPELNPNLIPVVVGNLIRAEDINKMSVELVKEFNARFEFFKNLQLEGTDAEQGFFKYIRHNHINLSNQNVIFREYFESIKNALENMNYGIRDTFENEYYEVRDLIFNSKSYIHLLKNNNHKAYEIKEFKLEESKILITAAGAIITPPGVNFDFNDEDLEIYITKDGDDFAKFLKSAKYSNFENNVMTLTPKTSDIIMQDLITASTVNKMFEHTKRARIACLCNCNYCACNCNYCVCNCNFCACNCNFCACNCNY